jgi:hypothetical protein
VGCDGMMIVWDLFLVFYKETGDFPENSKSRNPDIYFSLRPLKQLLTLGSFALCH